MRQTILILVSPERVDFYDYLASIKNVDFYLLWYADPEQMKIDLKELPLQFSKVIFWNQFRTPHALLKKLRPDKIVFFEIIDLRQISLVVTAKKLNIPTFYLEHGAASDKDTAIMRWKETTFAKHKLPYFLKRLREAYKDVFYSKMFYYSVTSGFHSMGSYFKYLMLPFKMLFGPPNKVLTHTIFKERVPDQSIVFNKSNYHEYALYTGVEEKEALLLGVPFFDKYFQDDYSLKKHVVFIDQPFLELGLLNWDKNHHRRNAEALFEFAKEKQIKVYIKLHPRSDLELWKSYSFEEDVVEIIQFGDFTDLYLSSQLILGFSSSLITALLCAKKNVVLLGWHPQPIIFGADFSKTGLCHVSFRPEELMTKFETWTQHNLTLENEKAYYQFLNQYNYPFDGRATERVTKAIVGNEIS